MVLACGVVGELSPERAGQNLGLESMSRNLSLSSSGLWFLWTMPEIPGEDGSVLPGSCGRNLDNPPVVSVGVLVRVQLAAAAASAGDIKPRCPQVRPLVTPVTCWLLIPAPET